MIGKTEHTGPEFTLTQITMITEIGGFVNHFGPGTRPFKVDILKSTNGVPDPSHILRTFVLTSDNDPTVISYESATISLLLRPGSYFALFAPQGDDEGYIIGGT